MSYLGLSFVLCDTENDVHKIYKMFPNVCHKLKTRAYIKNLRHSSLQMGLKTVQRKFEVGMCCSN